MTTTKDIVIAIRQSIKGAKIISTRRVRNCAPRAYDILDKGAVEIFYDNGQTIKIDYHWCGGMIEGECYRAHIIAVGTGVGDSQSNPGGWELDAVCRLAAMGNKEHARFSEISDAAAPIPDHVDA